MLRRIWARFLFQMRSERSPGDLTEIWLRFFMNWQRNGERKNGKKLPWSDAGYELKAFECIPVRFLFWDGDDEFPAQGNVLFDASATDFIHGESVVTIAAIGLDRIAKFAGVPLDRSTFPIF